MGYFHQDWYHDGDTAADVVTKHLTESEVEEALAVRRDAQFLRDLPSPTLEVLWDSGAQYMPSFHLVGGGAEWTRTVVALCDARLAACPEVRPLSGADTEEPPYGTGWLPRRSRVSGLSSLVSFLGAGSSSQPSSPKRSSSS